MTRTCAACPARIMPDQARRKLPAAERAGVRAHRGRGLCSGCYEASRRDGTVIDHEPLTQPRDLLLERALDLVETHGLRYRDLPAALEVSRGSLTRAVRRGVLEGDPRAATLSDLNTYPTKGAA